MNIVTAAPAAASTDTSPIRVEPVRNAAALRQFIRLPSLIYRGHPGYVAPLELERLDALRQDKNPFYQHANTVPTKATGPVGRISAQSTASLERHGADLGYFGIDGRRPAVFAAAGNRCRWLKTQGMRRCSALQPGITEEIGVMVDGFDARL
jgi:hypothetical protein